MMFKKFLIIIFLCIFLFQFPSFHVFAHPINNDEDKQCKINELSPSFEECKINEFSDGFDQFKPHEVDPNLINNKWRIDIPSWGCDWNWNPENVNKGNEDNGCVDGSVDITMKFDPTPISTDKKWKEYFSSGIIQSIKPILYGHFKARIKAAPAMPGTASAFWLYNDDYHFDKNSSDNRWWTEIDIVETGQGYDYFKQTDDPSPYPPNPMQYSSHRFKHPKYPRHEKIINSPKTCQKLYDECKKLQKVCDQSSTPKECREKLKEMCQEQSQKCQEGSRYIEFEEQHQKACRDIYKKDEKDLIDECYNKFDKPKEEFCYDRDYTPNNKNGRSLQNLKCIKSQYECGTQYPEGNIKKKKCQSKFSSYSIENSEFNPSEDYYIYELIWNKDELIWYVGDGEKRMEKRREENKWFHQPLYVTASLGLRPRRGKDSQSIFPTTMKVDYIYTYKNDFVPNGGFEYYGDDQGKEEEKCTSPKGLTEPLKCQNVNQWETDENGNKEADYITTEEHNNGQAALVHYYEGETNSKNKTDINSASETYGVRTYTTIKNLPKGNYKFNIWVKQKPNVKENLSSPTLDIQINDNDNSQKKYFHKELNGKDLDRNGEKIETEVILDKEKSNIEISIQSDSPYGTGFIIDDVELKKSSKEESTVETDGR